MKEAQIRKASPVEMRERLLSITLPGRTPRICAGWKAAVGELAAGGWFRGDAGRLRRYAAASALRALHELENVGHVGRRNEQRKRRLFARIKGCLGMLVEDLKLAGIEPGRMGL